MPCKASKVEVGIESTLSEEQARQMVKEVATGRESGHAGLLPAAAPQSILRPLLHTPGNKSFR